MSEVYEVVEFGAAEVETLQLSPGGPIPDTLYGFGWASGRAGSSISGDDEI